MNILLVEDDKNINALLTEAFIEYGYKVECAFDGEKAIDLICQKKYDFIILDINIPGIDGMDLLKEIRSDKIYTPVILTSAYEDFEHIKKAYDLGCDDYIKKPFDLKELILRIEYLRKKYKIEVDNIYRFNELIFYDYKTATIYVYNKEVALSKMEKKIMEYFIRNINKAVSMEELSLNIWSFDNRPTDSTIRSYIKTLRRKIGDKYFKTVKGVGYILKNGYN